jgi:hypothetical protein
MAMVSECRLGSSLKTEKRGEDVGLKCLGPWLGVISDNEGRPALSIRDKKISGHLAGQAWQKSDFRWLEIFALTM